MANYVSLLKSFREIVNVGLESAQDSLRVVEKHVSSGGG